MWRVLGALKVIAGKKQLSAGTMKKKGSQQMGKHVKSFVTEVKKNRALFVMAMPAFLLVLIMQYLPMSDWYWHLRTIDMTLVYSEVSGMDLQTSSTSSHPEPDG